MAYNKKLSGSPTFTGIPQLEQNGIRANKNQHKANVLGNQFQAVSSSSDYPQASRRNLPTLHGDLRKATLATDPRDPQINVFFSMDELKTAISETKNTAPGHDQLCYEMFGHLSNDCLETVLFLFNNIWSMGVDPQSWLHSIVIPIYKPVKPSNLASSYRPISLTSNACKIMEKMVVNRLKWYLEFYSLINNVQ